MNITTMVLNASPQLTSLDQIEDINQVESIHIHGDKNQLEGLLNKKCPDWILYLGEVILPDSTNDIGSI